MASILKRGTKYRAMVSLMVNGVRRPISKTFPNKKDARLWCERLELEKTSGKDLSSRNQSFITFYYNWMTLIKRNDVRDSTYNNYVRAYSIFKDMFPAIKMKDLDDIYFQKKLDEYGKTHAQKTVHELALKLRTCLKYAYAKGLISSDFASLIKAHGQQTLKRNRALSIADMSKLKKYLLAHSNADFNVFLLLVLETGIRRGEALGLRSDDLQPYEIRIRRSISPTSSDTSLKNSQSKRTISVTQTLYNLLESIDVKENGYLFNTNGFQQSHKLKNLLRKLNIPATTIHGLRDSNASYLFSKGIDLVYVSKRLGHESISTTRDYYLNLMPEKKHEQNVHALNLFDSL
ncbi:site-specific integrase [Lentilactobacillus buchneri]|uniref:tyrosine-type recombinase/integrase n=1 Tax=Lentilactobacillus buchneri TaxID=1581 RepID=UPI0021A4C298|nr:site-specific integrase [Lentilactobacillus buchneri]MCT2899037.1 site-specific integrase [Lentilactobacillus buchneri]